MLDALTAEFQQLRSNGDLHMNLYSSEQQIMAAIRGDATFMAYITEDKDPCCYSIKIDDVIFLIYYSIDDHYEVYIHQLSILNIRGREEIVRAFAERLQKVCNSL